MYSKLQNVSIGVLDSRLGPTLSCLVAEKRLIFKSATFLQQQQSQADPRVQAPRFESRPEWSLDLDSNLGACTRGSVCTLISAWLCCCGAKVADFKIYLFSATKQDRVGPSLLSGNTLFTFCSLLDNSRAPENLKFAENWPEMPAMCGLQDYQKSLIFVVSTNYPYYRGFYASFLGFQTNLASILHFR